MQVKWIVLSGLALAASLGWAEQTAAQSKVIALAGGPSPEAVKELVSAIQVMGRFRPGEVDGSQNAIRVSGTQDQIGLAEWLVGDLAQPAGRRYRVEDGSGDIVMVVHQPRSAGAGDLLEVMTTIRTITEFRYAYPYPSGKAMAFRGNAGQVRLTEWLVGELDQPSGRAHPVEDGSGDVTRVFRLAHSETPQDLSAMLILVRTITDLRRAFPNSARKALSFRGTPGQIELAEWLVGELDRPAAEPLPANSAARAHPVEDGSGDIAQVFHLAQAATPRDVGEVMTLIRTMTDVRRAFPYQARKALGFRGTADQMRLAAWLVDALERPPAAGQVQIAAGDEQVAVFFLPPSRSAKELWDLFGSVRTATAAPRVSFAEAQKAIAIRGAAAQIATAQRMIAAP